MPVSIRISAVRGQESRARFSKLLEIKENTLRNYEKGLSLPNSDIVAKICETFNVSSDWLLFGRGPMRPGTTVKEVPPRAETPPEPAPQAECPRCSKLEAKIEKLEARRDMLEDELRQVLRENGDLKAESSAQRVLIERISGRDVAVQSA